VLPVQDRSTAEIERTMRFARSLLEQQLIWARGGAIPSFKAVLESEEYKALDPQSNYAETAEIAVFDPAPPYHAAGSNTAISAVSA